jgi:hypothetical protein
MILSLQRIFILMFLAVNIWAADDIKVIDNKTVYDFDYYKKYVEETRVSFHFRKGRHLVYSCFHKHFVCVNGDGQLECDDLAKKAKDNEFAHKGCLRIRSYVDQKTCFDAHYKLSEKSGISSFCELDTSLR